MIRDKQKPTMTLPWLLLALLAHCQSASASASSILATPQTLTPVSCPSNQTTFVSLTEMVLEGRTKLLDKEERKQLTRTFQQIYNSLTQRSCDSYFRRIAQLSWVSMSNQVGDQMIMSNATGLMPMEMPMDMNMNMSDSNSTTMRRLQASNYTTEVPEINLVYQVTGTCRNCPVSRKGSFELYDDTFRRRLKESGIRLRQLSSSTVTAATSLLGLDDCRCVQGTAPSEPQPPGVQECVDEMNLQFEALRTDSNGELFEDIAMTDLLQLDEEEEEEDDEEGEEEEIEVEFGSGGGNDTDTAVERAGNTAINEDPSLSETILEEGMQEEPIATSGTGATNHPWTYQSTTLPWSLAGLWLFFFC